MRKLSIALATSLFLAGPTIVAAQPAFQSGVVQFTGDQTSNGTVGGFQVGPYVANLSGFTTSQLNASGLVIWCVDFSHLANTSADTYYATRLFGTTPDMSKTRLNSLTSYTYIAWLIEQYSPSSATYTAGNVQGTIWEWVGSGITAASSGTDDYTLNLTGLVPSTTPTLTRNWYVLSDDETGCTRFTSSTCNSNQEYLVSFARTTTAPEPSTYALMAAGLAAIGVVTRRRRTAKA